MKKIILTTAVLAIVLTAALGLAACTDDKIEIPDGSSDDGRELNEIYDIDDYESGVYLVPYEVVSDSTMGKMMVEKYCVSTVKVEKSGDGIEFAFYITDQSMMSNVRIVDESGNEQTGVEVNEFGYDGYEFEVGRENLDKEIAVKLFVNIMQRDTNFGIKLDLTQAKLVG